MLKVLNQVVDCVLRLAVNMTHEHQVKRFGEKRLAKDFLIRLRREQSDTHGANLTQAIILSSTHLKAVNGKEVLE